MDRTDDVIEALADALEPLALLAGNANMHDPLGKWFTVGQLYDARDALAMKAASPRPTGDVANVAIEAFDAIMEVGGEINPSNYNHEDVCLLNSAFIEQFQIAENARAAIAAMKAASPRPTGDVVEAAKAIFRTNGQYDAPWDDLPEATQKHFCRMAAAALQAVNPHHAEPTGDVMEAAIEAMGKVVDNEGHPFSYMLTTQERRDLTLAALQAADPRQVEPKPDVVAIALKLADDAEAQLCQHEDTHRGGTTWTICDGCGRKWADDEGGFVPYSTPAYIADARKALLAAIRPSQSAALTSQSQR